MNELRDLLHKEKKGEVESRQLPPCEIASSCIALSLYKFPDWSVAQTLKDTQVIIGGPLKIGNL